MEIVVTAKEAHRRIKASVPGFPTHVTFYRWLQSGQLSAQRIGARYFMPVSQVKGIIARAQAGEDICVKEQPE